ncbi:MAG: ribokinase [Clostridia bacterium]|nr:ribokinase [Clostridia bacterium]MBQ9848552.1 ribokinase [Clostridia bacterium]
MAKRILVAGSSNIDFLLSTPYIPAPGETIISNGSYAFAPGGKGANAAVACASLGAEVVFCSRVGDDAYGDRLVALFNERGIDTRYIKVDRVEQTGLAVVMLEKNGTNRIIVYSGANKKINDSDVESAFSCYPDAVLTQFEIKPDAVIAAALCAAEDGIPLFVDAGPATPDFPLEKLEKIEVLSPNETETEILTGIRPNTLENCLRASIALCNRVDTKYVVLKLGARGCYIYDGKYCDLVSPFEVPVVDTTAAGDIFTAALTTEYLKNGDILAAARFANAAGALATTKTGAISSVPTIEEINKLLLGE